MDVYTYTYIALYLVVAKEICIYSYAYRNMYICMRVYVYLVDGLYRRAELNKHPHCIRVPARARPQQRCPAVFLPALAGDYSTEVNWIR
jgi:hypothetical protein